MRAKLNMLKLKEKYKIEVVPKMIEKFGYKNALAVPRVEKAVLNIGFGRQVSGKGSQEREKIQEAFLNDLTLIAGQRLVLTKAKRSISAFKIRRGLPIGAKAVIRGHRMYDFLERLIYIALPRSRDFRGIQESSIDRQGQMTIGIKEHICFPEILPERAKEIFGFEVTVVTNAKKRQENIELFKLLGFPIKS